MNPNPLILIGGDKGGVGKSLVSIALLHHLLAEKQRVFLVESDTSNPDVWRCYEREEGVTCELLSLDDADGWISLVNQCAQHADDPIVINTAARINTGVEKHGNLLHDSLGDLGRTLIVYWVINRQRDSAVLLKAFTASMPAATVHVLRNLYWGAEAKFELYNTSRLRQELEAAGGLTLNFPELADRITDDLFSQRMSVGQALKELPLGNRAELRRWQNECAKVFDAVLNHPRATPEKADAREAVAAGD